MKLPHALLTNDDGIASHFLHALAEALRAHFSLTIAAPAREQSWIGRAMSRRREISVATQHGDNGPVWVIDGTPSDCVNIALGHLVTERPAVVVSGINIGYNTTVPLLYSSGTIAGALEGANWGIPALAVSQQVPDGSFEQITAGNGHLPPGMAASLRAAARLAARHALELAQSPPPDLHVHNLNFPMPVNEDTPWRHTRPARLRLPSLYQQTAPGRFSFRYSAGEVRPAAHPTDRDAILAGEISLSILNFSGLGPSKPEA